MIYCRTCLQPNTRPNTVFTSDSQCPACNYFVRLKDVDWEERFSTLENLISAMPKSDYHFHDCIVGVSGGKDSTRQAVWLRERFGLNPLLVCLSYPPEQVTTRGTQNLSNLIEQGFDVVISAPAPGVWKKLVKQAFLQFTNWAKSTEMALFAAVPQIAIRYEIPLIFWGENPGLQLGDMKTLGKTGYDGNNLRNMNTLGGGELGWQLKTIPDINKLIPYLYPTKEEFQKHNINIIYLGWFLKDWSNVNNAKYSTVLGLDVRTDDVGNTGDLWGVTALDEDWVTLNQMIKYYKFGFGRVTDYVNEAIRHGEITRGLGIKLVEKYDHSCSDEYIRSFCDYIEISVDAFWDQVIKSVNRDLFDVGADRSIKPKFTVGEGL